MGWAKKYIYIYMVSSYATRPKTKWLKSVTDHRSMDNIVSAIVIICIRIIPGDFRSQLSCFTRKRTDFRFPRPCRPHYFSRRNWEVSVIVVDWLMMFLHRHAWIVTCIIWATSALLFPEIDGTKNSIWPKEYTLRCVLLYVRGHSFYYI